ncbi:MAG: hypothetical protein IJH40_07905 [Ruminococcus sp.]|uniref:hypothetical protein n=1 Tax=Ruminococcus sp. TaxID=41978 RepID=UPI002872D93F|nr:hypothetical protein [Ruminococcus sp.]MBQ3285548.1 hypothetical protein [Ruminococcus sp.]
MRKKYIRPELSLKRFTLRDVILTSPEDISSHINGDDIPSDPIIDPDPIDWD